MDLMIDEFVDKGLYYKKISNDKVINITGEGGSGKSTLANGYRNDDDYLVVDYDLILLNPDTETIEYELKQMLLKKYGNTLFEDINKIGLDKVKDNFTTMYSEIINSLSNKNKTIVLDGTQLRFINNPKVIKGEFVALRQSLQTCISRSVERFIQNNPQANPEQIQKYTQKRTNVLHQLNPMMNDLLTQVDKISDIKDSKTDFDNLVIQNYLLENAKRYLDIIKSEYASSMSLEQIQILNKLLTTDCVEVNLNGKDYLSNQTNKINNVFNMSPFEKLQELRKLNIPLVHGGSIFEDDKIHFYSSVLSSKNPNLTTNELKEKCDELLIRELLHFIIKPKSLDITNFPDLKGINNFITEGLVDICIEDIQQKYGLFPNYNLKYSSNYIFVKEALSKFPNLSEKTSLVFNGSVQQIYEQSKTYNINQQTMGYKNNSETSSIGQINKHLDRISNNEDYKNPLTQNEYLQLINQDGYNILAAHKKLESHLEEKFKNYKGRESQFQYDCLYEYAAYVIPMIEQDYAFNLKPDSIGRLNELLTKNKIEISNAGNGSSHTNGIIEIPYVSESDPAFIKNTRYTLDVLLHEIFHQTHQYKVNEDLCYSINKSKNMVAPNYSGYLFEEGLTDKSTIDFARKHELSCSPMFEYHIYTQLVDNVEKKLNCTNGDLFDKDYREVFNKIDSTGQMLEQYRFAELSRYTSLKVKGHNENKLVEFDFEGKTHMAQKAPRLSEDFKNKSQVIRNDESKNNIEKGVKIGFDQRSQSEIQVAAQIKIKNQLIGEQGLKMMTPTNSSASLSTKGYVNVVILSLIISFATGILTMIIYSIFK